MFREIQPLEIHSKKKYDQIVREQMNSFGAGHRWSPWELSEKSIAIDSVSIRSGFLLPDCH